MTPQVRDPRRAIHATVMKRSQHGELMPVGDDSSSERVPAHSRVRYPQTLQRASMNMDVMTEIEVLFGMHGGRTYEGLRRETVTALEHALQCAQLAEWSGVDNALVAAALLHDIGHLLEPQASGVGEDDAHEQRGERFLRAVFPESIVEPVRLHVAAKRYLVTTDPRYLATLSSASLHSLRLQGGMMNRGECVRFASQPYAEDAVALRRWDDSAKVPGRKTPSLSYYLPLLNELRVDGPTEPVPTRAVIGSFDA